MLLDLIKVNLKKLKAKNMIIKETTTKILNVIYCLTVLLFLLDSLTSFNIKSQALKTIIYFGILIGTPLVLIWNSIVIKTKSKRIAGIVFPTIILIKLILIGPLKILFSCGSWQTQTVLYQNGNLSFKTVEFQMQDVGAKGYNKRTVEVLYLTNLFTLTSEVPKDIDQRVEW